MSTEKRPMPVLIVALLYMAVGIVGFTYHLPELRAMRQDNVWVELTEFLAVVAGVFLLRGHKWARWLAIVWIGFHVVLSAFHSYVQTAVHAAIFVLIAWALLTPASQRYFRPPPNRLE